MSKLSKALKPKAPWKRRPEVLLHAQIPQPMHEVAPRTILGAKWWNKVRKEAYRSTSWHCIACGIYKTDTKRRQLEAHEVYRIDYAKGLMVFVEVVPLCNFCHSYIHQGRLQAMMEKGQIPQATYVAVIQHGDKVLREAGLSKPPLYNGKIAAWGKWRLVINGKKYPPKHKTYDLWLRSIGNA